MSAAHAVPDYEDLLEEIHWLRHMLGLEIGAEKVSRLVSAWRLTPAEAHLLLVLHARRGRMVTYAFVEDNVPSPGGRAGERSDKILMVWVHRIRRKIGRDAITTHWGLGLSASSTVIERIDALLQDLKRP